MPRVTEHQEKIFQAQNFISASLIYPFHFKRQGPEAKKGSSVR